MTIRLGPIATDFEQDTSEGRVRSHEWLGDSCGMPFSHPKEIHPRLHDGVEGSGATEADPTCDSWSLLMDGRHDARAVGPDETQPTPATDPADDPGRGPVPEREWGLSARQVALAVVIIVALCQALGAIYSP